MWTMLETHIKMSSLIFCLTFLLVLCLIFFMDLTIDHMVLVHNRVALCLDALVLTHVLIVVFSSFIACNLSTQPFVSFYPFS
jgi:hypothetical protein